jgi:O-antigen/teichoic acid export membrane protein
MFFSDPLLVAIYPELSHLHANRHLVQLHKLLRTMTLALAVFAAVCVGGFAITGRWILSRFAGASYEAAYPVVLIMFAGSAASMVFFWARPLLLVRGHARTLVCIAIAASIAQVVGLYLLVPSMGAVGAGLAFALNYVVNIGLFLIVIVRSGRAQRIVPA